MKKKILLTLIICLSVIFVMAACNPKAGNDGRTKYDTPSMELFDAEVTADSIEIICDKFYDEYKNGDLVFPTEIGRTARFLRDFFLIRYTI